jgi:hypothetical protein
MEIINDQPEEPSPSPELDGQKIRQLTALRRGAIRARSWCLITAGVCLVGALQLILNTIQLVRRTHSWGVRPTLYVFTTIAACIIAAYSIRRAIALGKEINKPFMEEPQTSPDFSTLSNGNHRLHDLENIQ